MRILKTGLHYASTFLLRIIRVVLSVSPQEQNVSVGHPRLSGVMWRINPPIIVSLLTLAARMHACVWKL